MKKIMVDVWAGHLHQSLIESRLFDHWLEASDYMEKQVYKGFLCNVLTQPEETISDEEIIQRTRIN